MIIIRIVDCLFPISHCLLDFARFDVECQDDYILNKASTKLSQSKPQQARQKSYKGDRDGPEILLGGKPEHKVGHGNQVVLQNQVGPGYKVGPRNKVGRR